MCTCLFLIFLLGASYEERGWIGFREGVRVRNLVAWMGAPACDMKCNEIDFQIYKVKKLMVLKIVHKDSDKKANFVESRSAMASTRQMLGSINLEEIAQRSTRVHLHVWA